MTIGLLLELAFYSALCGVATLLVAGAATLAGWTDDGSDAPHRKLQKHGVAVVGGIVLYGALLVLGGVGRELLGQHRSESEPGDCYAAWALTSAFAIGLWDDLTQRGLSARLKLALQVVVAVLCALAAREASHPSAGVPFVVALLAMNAFNTFDNADGAATSLGALGLGAAGLLSAAAPLGFLPFNLWVRRKAPDGSSTPIAYLGDAGSHLLGVLVALVPAAWPVLVLPLADLARLSVVRVRKGSRPWIGDRRHLAHRLQARGLGPTAVVLVLLAIAAPAVVAPVAFPEHAWSPLLGAGATLVLFLAAVRATPDLA